MTRLHRRHPARGVARLAGLLTLLLAGCVSGPAPRDHFYRLEVRTPEPLPEPFLAGVVEVDRPRADTLTDQLPLLFREESTAEIRRYGYHRWMTAPSQMVQNALIDYLRAARAAERVVSPEVRVPPDYHVTGRIDRLERVVGGAEPRVVVVLELGVSDGGGELLLLERYREELEAGGAGVDDAVLAYDAALERIFARFVVDLREAAP